MVTGAQLREQIDLVDRLKTGDTELEEGPAFLVFAWSVKVGDAGDQATVEQLKKLHSGLAPEELGDLRKRFRMHEEGILDAMWDLRAKSVPDEAAIERCLIPDEAEMNKIMRY